MNRQERRRKRKLRNKKEREQTTLRKSETTEHATVMVVNNPEWTPFEEATWLAPLSRAGEKIFINSRYQVAVYPPAPALGGAKDWPRCVHLCFKHVHNIAITDFRDFQRIKNELVDPAAFTFQIFPAFTDELNSVLKLTSFQAALASVHRIDVASDPVLREYPYLPAP